MTRFLVPLHRFVGTPRMITPLLERALDHAEERRVIDLCSGSCGPMLAVCKQLHEQPQTADVEVTFSDLYPQPEAVSEVNAQGDRRLRYHDSSVDATAMPAEWRGARTMCCAMHHLPPPLARSILQDAFEQRQPIMVFEISDNSLPRPLWPLAFPAVALLTLLLTPWVRPLTARQLLLTYALPALPLLVGWDGAVSNARTYTLADMSELIDGLNAPDYRWEMGVAGGFGPMKQLYLLGLPKREP